MTHFVIVYHRRRGEIIARRDYPDSEYAQAWAERNRLTMLHLADRDIEVVMLGAESEADIRVTHGRYFERTAPTLVDKS